MHVHISTHICTITHTSVDITRFPAHIHTHTHILVNAVKSWTLKNTYEIIAPKQGPGCVKLHSLTADFTHRTWGTTICVWTYHSMNRGLTGCNVPFFFFFTCVSTCICIRLHHFSNRGQSTVTVLSSIWCWCVGSCPRFPVKTNAHTHTHTHTHSHTHKQTLLIYAHAHVYTQTNTAYMYMYMPMHIHTNGNTQHTHVFWYTQINAYSRHTIGQNKHVLFSDS